MATPRVSTKPAVNSAALRELEGLLREETALCEQYLAIIAKEQVAITKLNVADVTQCATQREGCLAAMEALKERRTELLRSLSETKKVSATEVITRLTQGKERQRLLGLVEKLRGVLSRVEGASRECGHVVDFSLGLVNGSLSILWSATQDVTKGYTPYGTITQGSARQPRRRGGSLGEA